MIDCNLLDHNAKIILNQCKKNGITSCFLVTKVLAGNTKIIRHLATVGFSHLADSRIENLIRCRNIPLPKVLLRLPMQSEAMRVVRYADISLNSELSTIQALSIAAGRQNKIHEIILMFDLGDLREGIFYQNDYLPIVYEIEKCSHVRLIGIGTNLTCFGGVIPDRNNLNMLTDIQKKIETAINRPLQIVSGGNSSSLYLLDSHTIPGGINNLRLGEAVFLGRETAYGQSIPGTNSDAFVLQAELIEVAKKPSHPIGMIGMDSFGVPPIIKDQGIMNRGILAIGRQDIEKGDLVCLDERVSILGSSSDHLIVDLGNTNYAPGDILEFAVNYPGLLRLMTSPYVKKTMRWGKRFAKKQENR
jgi:predicted amino acid racemase